MVRKEELANLAELIERFWTNAPYPLTPSQLNTKWQSDFTIAVYKSKLTSPLTDEETLAIKSATYHRYVQQNIDSIVTSIETDIENSLKKLSSEIKSLQTTAELFSHLKAFYDKQLVVFVDTYSVFYTADDTLSAKIPEIEREYQYAIFNSLQISKKKLIQKFVKDIEEYQDEVLAAAKGFIEVIKPEQAAKQVELLTKYVEERGNEFKEYFDRSLGEYPQFVLEYNKDRLRVKIQALWHDTFHGGLNDLITKFKKFCTNLLKKFQASEYTLFNPNPENKASRKVLAEIAIKTAPPQFGQTYPLLSSLLGHLMPDEDAEALLSLSQSQTDLKTLGDSYLSSTSLSVRSEDLFGLVLVLSETYNYVKEPTQANNKKYQAVNREWIRQIIFASCRTDLIKDMNFTPKYTEWSFVDIVEQVVGGSFDDDDWVTDDIKINESPKFGFIDWVKRIFGDSKKFRILDLERIKKGRSLHTTISISGWLSEADNMEDAWKHLIEQSFQGHTYSLRWDSSSYLEMIFYDLPVFIFSVLAKVSRGLFLTIFSKKFEGKLPFAKRIGIAEETGKALAACIINNVMGSSCVSLIGFSLGTRVMYSCMQELKQANIQVHDVYLLGGATPVNMPDWDNVRLATAGRMVNTFSYKDMANQVFYRLDQLVTPIGAAELVIKTPNIGVCENFDVTNEAGMHLHYRKNMEKVFEKIGYNVY